MIPPGLIYKAPVRREVFSGSQAVTNHIWDVLCRVFCLRKGVNKKSCKIAEDNRHSKYHFSIPG